MDEAPQMQMGQREERSTPSANSPQRIHIGHCGYKGRAPSIAQMNPSAHLTLRHCEC